MSDLNSGQESGRADMYRRGAGPRSGRLTTFQDAQGLHRCPSTGAVGRFEYHGEVNPLESVAALPFVQVGMRRVEAPSPVCATLAAQPLDRGQHPGIGFVSQS